MPGVDMNMVQLETYRGSYPMPDDFEAFWQGCLSDISDFPPKMTSERMPFANRKLQYETVQMHAADGTLLSAKYIHPVGAGTYPLVVQFHDYPGASRSWQHLTRYGALGYAVLAPDCRGQGGKSGAGAAGKGPTACGTLFQGLLDEPKHLYLYQLYADAFLWIKAAHMLENVDKTKILVYGEGQGAALALACAAMYPALYKCAAHMPMLCDYKRVWEKDFDVNVYEGLRYFFRWQDPLHEREDEVFQKLAYMDVKNFAPMIRIPVLMSIGLQDTVSPPSAQFAVANALQCPKRLKIYPKHGHELNNFFENELLKFLIN